MKKSSKISVVVAIGKNSRSIGANNKLLWHIPVDLKRFKDLTLGHPAIMGRKTFESILDTLGKPLPGRKNIIVTKDTNYYADGVDIVHSLDKGIDLAKSYDEDEIFIIGGGQIYKQALPLADRLYLTIVNSNIKGDTFFPSYEKLFTKEISREKGKDGELEFTWLTLER